MTHPSTMHSRLFLFLILGSIYALTLFGVYWTEGKEDRIAHMTGAHYFVHDTWRLPVFSVPKIAIPEGGNIVYTDSLPIIALVAKICFNLTGLDGNYFGLWIFLCFPLLALFIALATQESGNNKFIALLGAVILALTSPALLTRLEHAALMGHFLIAWGLFLYLKLIRSPNFWHINFQFYLLIVLTILIQPYFFIMVTPFFFAALIQGARLKQFFLRKVVVSVMILVIISLSVAVIAGIIGRSSNISNKAEGFGLYSMNLISPFLPLPEHLPEWISRHIPWDHRKILTWDATTGQYEGYNYLGAGLILLLIIHLFFSKALIWEALKRHVFLVVFLSGLFLYALSNRIFFGNWLICEIPMSLFFSEITAYFRVGARLFWPIYYVLVVGLTILTFQRFKTRTATTIICCIIALQFIDTQPLRRKLIHEASTGFPQIFPKELWSKLLKEHQFYFQFPSFQCGGLTGQNKFPDLNIDLEFIRLAGQLGKGNNSAYLGRPSRSSETEMADAQKFDIHSEGLYLFGKGFRFGLIAHNSSIKTLCRECEFGLVCSRKWNDQPYLASQTYFQPITTITALNYHLENILRFSYDGKSQSFLGKGWSFPEQWGIWSLGTESEIALSITEPLCGNLRLIVHAFAFLHSHRQKKKVIVFANDVPVATWIFQQDLESKKRIVLIPQEIYQRNSEVLLIKFLSEECESPMQAGLSQDKREISLGLIDLSITKDE